MGEIAEALRRARDERELLERSVVPSGRVRVGARTAVAGPARQRSPRGGFAAPARPPKAEPSSRRAVDSAKLLQIPRTRQKRESWAARAVLVDRAGPIAECFRHFAIRVRRELEARKTHSVLVTSALPQEGKTVTACNLAFALASMAAERRVALVDLDLRRAGMVGALGIKPRLGMERVLWGESPLASVCSPTDVANLDLFPVEAPRKKVHELLSGKRLASALSEIEKHYDLVVIDTPPVLLVPDVPLIAPHVGTIVAVSRAGLTRRASFDEMLELLPRERVIGGFLNDVRKRSLTQGDYPGYDDLFGIGEERQ